MTNSTENLTTIEINGIKMEVDLRYAKKIETLTIGSKVKLLVKTDYSEPVVHSGIVVGFEPFESLPTIIICYLSMDYSSAELKFAHINEKSKDKYDMVVSIDDTLPIKKADVLSKIDRAVAKKQVEIEDLEIKREYFLKHFNKWFEPTIEKVN